MASFVGFVPAEDPQISILVVIDEPMGQFYGGVVAAPVFRKIAFETLNYMGKRPKNRRNSLRASREMESQG